MGYFSIAVPRFVGGVFSVRYPFAINHSLMQKQPSIPWLPWSERTMTVTSSGTRARNAPISSSMSR